MASGPRGAGVIHPVPNPNEGPSTRWSLVLRAVEGDAQSAFEALSTDLVQLVWRPARSGDFFKAFDGEIAVGVGHVVPDARPGDPGR